MALLSFFAFFFTPYMESQRYWTPERRLKNDFSNDDGIFDNVFRIVYYDLRSEKAVW